MRKLSNSSESIIKTVSRLLSITGMFFLLVMMMLTVIDVFMRYIFSRPILGSTELTEYMMIFLTLGMAWCLLQGRSIRMDLIVSHFSRRVQAIIDTFTYTISLVIMVLITWQTLSETFAIKKMMLTSAVLRIPTYPFYGLLTLAFFVFTLAILINLIESIAKAAKQ